MPSGFSRYSQRSATGFKLAPTWADACAQKSRMSGSGRTGALGRALSRRLKIKLLNVLLSEHEGLSQQHIVALYFQLTEPPAIKLCRASFELPFGHSDSRQNAQVTQVLRVPQDYRRGDAIPHIPFVVVGQAKANDLHVLAAALLHGLRGAGHRRRTNRHQQFDVR